MTMLPWQPITPEQEKLGSDALLVCCEDRIVFAVWRYGWDPTEEVGADHPMWCEHGGSLALSPQPTLYLPLTLPNGDIPRSVGY